MNRSRSGRRGTAISLNCEGIDFSDDNRSWTRAPVAEMDVQLSVARQDVVLEIEASPYLVPNGPRAQNVFIYLAGLFVGYFNLKGHAVRSFSINRASVSGRATRLALVIPTAISPHALGLGEDMRQLGLYLVSLTFRTTAYAPRP